MWGCGLDTAARFDIFTAMNIQAAVVCVVKPCSVAVGFSWFRIGSRDGVSWTGRWTFGFDKGGKLLDHLLSSPRTWVRTMFRMNPVSQVSNYTGGPRPVAQCHRQNIHSQFRALLSPLQAMLARFGELVLLLQVVKSCVSEHVNPSHVHVIRKQEPAGISQLCIYGSK
jgi:hypothetical protein